MRYSYNGIPINTAKNTHEAVFSLLSKERINTIVDIPCGAGAFTSRLKDSGYTNISSVDVVSYLKIEHDGFRVGDMNEKLPFDDNSQDAVVSIDGIEHIARQFDFVREVSRILKSGGEFVVSTPNTSSLRSRFRWLMTGHHHKCIVPLDEGNPNPTHHIAMLSFPELRYMLHTNGFKIVEVTTNRVKFINLFFALLVPFIFVATWRSYSRHEKNPLQKKRNKDIIKQMFSFPILFGEIMVIKALKK